MTDEPICTCGHLEEEHNEGECEVPNCPCFAYEEGDGDE